MTVHLNNRFHISLIISFFILDFSLQTVYIQCYTYPHIPRCWSWPQPTKSGVRAARFAQSRRVQRVPPERSRPWPDEGPRLWSLARGGRGVAVPVGFYFRPRAGAKWYRGARWQLHRKKGKGTRTGVVHACHMVQWVFSGRSGSGSGTGSGSWRGRLRSPIGGADRNVRWLLQFTPICQWKKQSWDRANSRMSLYCFTVYTWASPL